MLFIGSIPSGFHVARREHNRAPMKIRMVVVSRITASSWLRPKVLGLVVNMRPPRMEYPAEGVN